MYLHKLYVLCITSPEDQEHHIPTWVMGSVVWPCCISLVTRFVRNTAPHERRIWNHCWARAQRGLKPWSTLVTTYLAALGPLFMIISIDKKRTRGIDGEKPWIKSDGRGWVRGLHRKSRSTLDKNIFTILLTRKYTFSKTRPRSNMGGTLLGYAASAAILTWGGGVARGGVGAMERRQRPRGWRARRWR